MCSLLWSHNPRAFSIMATKIKGICKGSFKYISQIFVVKEREIEIGFPTDVKHVAHIGWEGSDGTAPSWMNDFQKGSDFALASMGSAGSSRDPTWTSQDFEKSFGRQSSSAMLSNFPPTNLPSRPKKPKRKKTRSSSTSSPKSSSARSSRSSKSKSALGETEEGESHYSMKL